MPPAIQTTIELRRYIPALYRVRDDTLDWSRLLAVMESGINIILSGRRAGASEYVAQGGETALRWRPSGGASGQIVPPYMPGSGTIQVSVNGAAVAFTETDYQTVTLAAPLASGDVAIVSFLPERSAATLSCADFGNGRLRTVFRAAARGFGGNEILFSLDIPAAWATGTLYALDDLASNDGGNVYRCTTPGRSATSGPGPVGVGSGIVDDGVVWTGVGPAAVAVDEAAVSVACVVGRNAAAADLEAAVAALAGGDRLIEVATAHGSPLVTGGLATTDSFSARLAGGQDFAAISIDALEDIRDPSTCDFRLLPYLAQQLGGLDLDDSLPVPLQRKIVANIVALLKEKGTNPGIVDGIRLFLGVESTVDEFWPDAWTLDDDLDHGTTLAPDPRAPAYSRGTLSGVDPALLLDNDALESDGFGQPMLPIFYEAQRTASGAGEPAQAWFAVVPRSLLANNAPFFWLNYVFEFKVSDRYRAGVYVGKTLTTIDIGPDVCDGSAFQVAQRMQAALAGLGVTWTIGGAGGSGGPGPVILQGVVDSPGAGGNVAVTGLAAEAMDAIGFFGGTAGGGGFVATGGATVINLIDVADAEEVAARVRMAVAFVDGTLDVSRDGQDVYLHKMTKGTDGDGIFGGQAGALLAGARKAFAREAVGNEGVGQVDVGFSYLTGTGALAAWLDGVPLEAGVDYLETGTTTIQLAANPTPGARLVVKSPVPGMAGGIGVNPAILTFTVTTERALTAAEERIARSWIEYAKRFETHYRLIQPEATESLILDIGRLGSGRLDRMAPNNAVLPAGTYADDPAGAVVGRTTVVDLSDAESRRTPALIVGGRYALLAEDDCHVRQGNRVVAALAAVDGAGPTTLYICKVPGEDLVAVSAYGAGSFSPTDDDVGHLMTLDGTGLSIDGVPVLIREVSHETDIVDQFSFVGAFLIPPVAWIDPPDEMAASSVQEVHPAAATWTVPRDFLLPALSPIVVTISARSNAYIAVRRAAAGPAASLRVTRLDGSP
jgi:phage tail-like protein